MIGNIRQWSARRAEKRVALVLSRRTDWTAEKSLQLVDALCSGKGLHAAATEAGVTPESALKHWRDLMPEAYRGGIDNQKHLIDALRNAIQKEEA